MFDILKAVPGDILLFKAKDAGDLIGDFIKLFSNGGPYTHGAVYVGDGSIIESHINTGVVEKKLNLEYSKNIDIYRMPGVTELLSDRLINYMRTTELGKGYDLAAFPSAWLRSSVASVWGWRNFRKGRPVLNDDAHRFCTELVAVSFKNAIGLDVCEGLDPHSVTPNDIGRSKNVTKVC